MSKDSSVVIQYPWRVISPAESNLQAKKKGVEINPL
jgi:hypothetical protein